jgi:D-3-phosphoglycerate dehydrogenase / 2-oxoglutarate reductase
MKIVIPDDYQDMIDQLECFSLIRHHDVIRYREPARDLTHLVERLCDAEGRKSSLEKADAAGYASAASKQALFERSDVLSLHVRLARDTYGIVGSDDLDRMKPTALIVNTSRAELIAPGALLAALRKGRPGYAAVDVYEHEPVTNANHPFLSMPNVLCTPHLGWAEWTNFELYFLEAFEQIVAYQQGLPLRLANPEVQPRN